MIERTVTGARLDDRSTARRIDHDDDTLIGCGLSSNALPRRLERWGRGPQSPAQRVTTPPVW